MTKGRARGSEWWRRRGKKKSSRYLFNFTVEPFWQEAIILFFIFFLHDISAPPTPRAYIFVPTLRRRFNIPPPRALLRQFSRHRITI